MTLAPASLTTVDLLPVGIEMAASPARSGRQGGEVELVGAGAAGERTAHGDRASAPLRVISSRVAAQSRPIPRCAVSIASATPSP